MKLIQMARETCDAQQKGLHRNLFTEIIDSN